MRWKTPCQLAVQSYSPPQVGPRAKWAAVAAWRPTRSNAFQHGVEILDVM
jgi:hypothetical protein